MNQTPSHATVRFVLRNGEPYRTRHGRSPSKRALSDSLARTPCCSYYFNFNVALAKLVTALPAMNPPARIYIGFSARSPNRRVK